MEPIPPGLSPDQVYFIEHGRYPNTMSPDTLSTLSRVLSRLNDLLPDVRNFCTTEKTISFQYGRDVGYRGEYETEWEHVEFTWEEFLDEEGSYAALDTLCKARWGVVRAERRKAEKLAEEERKKAEALERAEFDRLAPARKREKELEELRKLMAAYPDEVKSAALARLDATTS